MMRRWGMKPVTFEHEREYYDVIRRMLSGEIVRNYSGAIGEFPQLGYSDYVKEGCAHFVYRVWSAELEARGHCLRRRTPPYLHVARSRRTGRWA